MGAGREESATGTQVCAAQLGRGPVLVVVLVTELGDPGEVGRGAAKVGQFHGQWQ